MNWVFMRLLCAFGLHQWVWFKAVHYIDTSYNRRRESTQAHKRCSCCGEIEEKSFWGSGYLQLSELNGTQPLSGGRKFRVIEGGKP